MDLLTLAGHKFYASKGIGALYVRAGTPIGGIVFGADREHGLRPGTENVPAIVGFGAARLARERTDEQRAKAERLRDRDGFTNVTYVKGYIENVPAPAASVDVVISNGVINLATDKSKVFSEVARLLKSGGRFAISDIVTEVQLPENIVCNSTLWAACIGGAAQQDNYRDQIAAAGMKVVKAQDNPTYQFISDNARGASKKFGVKSISLLAVKP